MESSPSFPDHPCMTCPPSRFHYSNPLLTTVTKCSTWPSFFSSLLSVVVALLTGTFCKTKGFIIQCKLHYRQVEFWCAHHKYGSGKSEMSASNSNCLFYWGDGDGLNKCPGRLLGRLRYSNAWLNTATNRQEKSMVAPPLVRYMQCS